MRMMHCGYSFLRRRNFPTTKPHNRLEKLKNGNFTLFSQEGAFLAQYLKKTFLQFKHICFRRWSDLCFVCFLKFELQSQNGRFFITLSVMGPKRPLLPLFTMFSCFDCFLFCLFVCLLLLLFFLHRIRPDVRSSSCWRSRAPGWRDHCSFQPYPWQIQAWNFLCSSNIWLYHILQIGIKIEEREKHISAHARDSRDTRAQKITAKSFNWSFNSEQTVAAS